MNKIALSAFFFCVALCSRVIPETITWVNGIYSLSLLNVTIEVLSFISAVYIAVTLKWAAPNLALEKYGLVKLIVAGIITVQAIILTSTMLNLSFSIKSSVALRDYEDAEVTSDNEIILIDGVIGKNTYSIISAKLKKNKITQVIIRSPGGLIDQSIKIGKLIEKIEMPIQVLDFCESSCVIIASYSKHLTAKNNSVFGFHQGASLVQSESSLSKYIALEATNNMVNTLHKNGVPQEVLDIAAETRPSEMYYVTAARMHELGFVKEIQP